MDDIQLKQHLVDDQYLHMTGFKSDDNSEKAKQSKQEDGDGEYDYVQYPRCAGTADDGYAFRKSYMDVPEQSQIPYDTYLEVTKSGFHSPRGPLEAPPAACVSASSDCGRDIRNTGKVSHDQLLRGIVNNRKSLILVVTLVLALIMLVLIIGLAVALSTRVSTDTSEPVSENKPYTVIDETICIRGPHGNIDQGSQDNFSDENLAANRTPSAFQFWTAQNHIVALRVQYDYDTWGDIHGLWGDEPTGSRFTSTIQTLKPDEWVNDVYVGSDLDHEGVVPAGIYTVVQLQLVTNKKVLPQVGYDAKDVKMASGKKLSFISGWSALAIDMIKFHFLSC